MAFKLLERKLVISVFLVLWAFCSISGAMSRSTILYDKAFFVKKHEEWMAEHGRIYPHQAEKDRRLEIFMENLRFIEKHNNEGNRTFKLSLNRFADLTNDEFVSFHLGAKVSNSTPKATTTSFMHGKFKYDQIPAYFDWREKGAVTDVKNQSLCESCWSFAVTATVESIVKIRTGKLYSLSEQQLLDCVYHDTDTDPCRVGGNPDLAFDYIMQNGIVSENDYTYMGRVNHCDQNTVESKRLTMISGYVLVPSNNEDELLKAVNMQPVMVAVDSSGPAFQFYSKGIFTPDSCGSCGLNHVFLLIGYGVSDDGTKYWLVKNSWGKNWGEGGYMRLQRDCGYPEGTCGLATFPEYPVY